MRKLVYLVAVTADGFIAGPDGNFDFFSNDPATLAEVFAEYPETCPAHVRDLLGVTGAPRHFDAVVLGRATHQPALDAGLSSAYPHLDQYVVTHDRNLPDDDHVTVIDGDPLGFIRKLKQQPGLDIWLCGGGNLAAQLLPEIDEFHLKVNPVLIGSGIPLLASAPAPTDLTLLSTRLLPGGVQLNIYSGGTQHG